MRIFLLITIVLLSAASLFAQYESVFPGLEGQNLLDELRDNYRPTINLSYGEARDTLYGNIESPNDSLTCVYTGYTIYLDPALDPTTAAFMNDGPDAINTEHTYPQGLGASGPLRADMHNFYPSRKDVNGERGSDPFGEINDNQTETWWILDQNQTTIPTSNIDAYSEDRNGLFEPRDVHKGNVARSMFYFYTIYKAEADAEDPNYFNSQVQTLCDWHVLDPVDAREYDRTKQIAVYQDGLENPFVLDCTLAERSYCSGLIECDPISSTSESVLSIGRIARIAPNPSAGQTQVQYLLRSAATVQFSLVDMLGKQTLLGVDRQSQAGIYTYEIGLNGVKKGMYLLQIVIETNSGVQIDIQKVIFQ